MSKDFYGFTLKNVETGVEIHQVGEKHWSCPQHQLAGELGDMAIASNRGNAVSDYPILCTKGNQRLSYSLYKPSGTYLGKFETLDGAQKRRDFFVRSSGHAKMAEQVQAERAKKAEESRRLRAEQDRIFAENEARAREKMDYGGW